MHSDFDSGTHWHALYGRTDIIVISQYFILQMVMALVDMRTYGEVVKHWLSDPKKT